jgi:hypothetical protein
MAKYLLLIYGNEQMWDAMTPQEMEDLDAAHAAFAANVGAKVLHGHALESTSTSTTLHGTVDGRPTPTDGPFLETKEALGGFYLVEAHDLDEAISFAAQLPEVRAVHSGVEIRPVREPA